MQASAACKAYASEAAAGGKGQVQVSAWSLTGGALQACGPQVEGGGTGRA